MSELVCRFRVTRISDARKDACTFNRARPRPRARARGRIIERDEAAYWELQSSRFPIDGISSTAAFPYCRLDALDFRRIETSESSADERSINPRCSRRRRESRFPDVCRVRRSCLPSLRPSPSQPNPPPLFMARTRHRLKNRLVPYPKRLDRTAADTSVSFASFRHFHVHRPMKYRSMRYRFSGDLNCFDGMPPCLYCSFSAT